MAQSEIATPVESPVRKRVLRWLGRLAMRLFVPPLRSLPLPAGRRLGSTLGILAYRILGRYRNAAQCNLKLIYGDSIPEAQREKMAKAVFKHFGTVGAEFLKTPSLSKERVNELSVVQGEEHLKSALASGKGVLLITGHFGNWEFLARWITINGYVLNVVARDARDPKATQLLADTRGSSGSNVLYRGNSARAILGCLKRNEIVGILPDQNAADVFVPFLGIRTGTVDGPAVLHLKTRAPMLFSWCVRRDDGKFDILFEPPFSYESTPDKAADVEAVMTEVNARLGDQVRQHPTQWLWLHNRWKATPGVFADWEANYRDIKGPPRTSLGRDIENSNGSADR